MASIADALADVHRYLGAGEFARAEQALRQVLHQAPSHYEALCLLGFALQHRGEFDEAERCYAGALEIQPDSAAAWFARATIQRRLMRPDEAAESFKRT